MTSLNLDHAFHPAFGVPTGPFVSINCSELESHALSYPWDLLPQPRTHAHYCLLSIAYPILSNNSVSVLHLVFLRPLPLNLYLALAQQLERLCHYCRGSSLSSNTLDPLLPKPSS